MLFILRILAIVTMLLALTEAALVAPDAMRALSGREAAAGQSGGGDSPSKTTPFVDRIRNSLHILHSPAFLFCSGAMVYVLTRIAATQEDGPPAT